VSTIQFVAALARLKEDLTTEYTDPKGLLEESTSTPSRELNIGHSRMWKGKYEAIIPRSKPLSPGEILGCTSPYLTEDVDAIMYVR
jgi:2-(3-amino-3-carboxypropyl)histidine synthase